MSAVGSWSSGANSSQPSGNHSGVVPGGGQEAGGFWPAPSALRTGRRGRKSQKCRAFKFSGRLQPEQGDRAPRVVPMGVQGGLGRDGAIYWSPPSLTEPGRGRGPRSFVHEAWRAGGDGAGGSFSLSFLFLPFFFGVFGGTGAHVRGELGGVSLQNCQGKLFPIEKASK